MKICLRSASRRTRTSVARVLACVLLTGIIYSATFGVVHSHGNVSSQFETNISAGFMQQTAALSEVPLHSRSDADQCLICVLHRQFSSSTVHSPLFIAATATPIALVSAPSVFYRSNTIVSGPIARMSGRAPPQAQA